MPPLDVIEQDFETYFWATKSGIDLQSSHMTSWPFESGHGDLSPFHTMVGQAVSPPAGQRG